jgi:3'-phosphoadenosine 5'-phosphosulfate sulfotransferase (PAPS reductase)/FAD synthetase
MEIMLDMFEEANIGVESFDPTQEIGGLKATTSDLTQTAIEILLKLLLNNSILCSSLSGGKDSVTMTSLALVAMRMLVEQSGSELSSKPVIHLITSDTGNENIIKKQYLVKYFQRCEWYGQAHGFDVVVHQCGPTRVSSFMRVYSGGKPDPRPKMSSKKKECATSMKVEPIQRELRSLKKETEKSGRDFVMLVGSRDEESTSRQKSLEKYNASESSTIVVNGYKTLYPIKNWTLENIWEYLTFAEDTEYLVDAMIPGSQDGFPETAELYAGFNGGGCVTSLGHDDVQCGARDGCSSCMVVENDRSAENQADHSDYKHIARTLKDILALRNWRKDFGDDYQNRNFISMVDSDGYLDLRPNGYSGWMLEENLRFILTIQERDKERANDLSRAVSRIEEKIENGTIANLRRANTWLRKVKPHCTQLFQIIDESDILWMDFQWSLRGLTRKAHNAVRIWDEIVNKGIRAEIPNEDYVRPSEVTTRPYKSSKSMPPLAKIYHGIVCDSSLSKEEKKEASAANFFDLTHDMFGLDKGPGDQSYTVNSEGDTIDGPVMNVADSYDVNEETAVFILDNPQEFLLTKQVEWWPEDFKHQNAIRRLLQLGVIKVNKRWLRYINEKMDLLYFTATEGLQELAYIGGPLSTDDNSKIEIGDSNGTLQMF